MKINVEAYVVKGMMTPFILGNDFTDQYDISTMRENGISHLVFGASQRRLRIENSTGESMLDNEGHAFRIHTLPGL